MTARASSPIRRVSTSPAVQGRTWSMRSTDVRAFLDALQRLGHDRNALLEVAKVGASQMDDPDALISCESLGAVLESAQRRRFTPNLGLALARVTPLGAYPLLDYLVLTSDVVASAVRQLARYMHLVGNPVELTIDDARDPVRVNMINGAAPTSVEYSVGLILLHLRHETDGAFAASGVEFEHVPDDRADFERGLGCPVRGGAPRNRLTIPAASWRLPLHRGDPILRRVLEAHADATRPVAAAPTSLRDGVRASIMRRLERKEVQIAAVAHELAMSARTLQRKLAADGVSFQALLDEARKEAAARYIAESSLAICEVAYLVGYSEPAPFHRAFRRWFGATPDVYRQQRRSSGR